MTDMRARAARLAKLEALAELKATHLQAKLGRCLADEARASQEAEALTERRREAQVRVPAGDLQQAGATLTWLRASHEELRRLNIQHAALRARSETVRAEAARAVARQSVLGKLRQR